MHCNKLKENIKIYISHHEPIDELDLPFVEMISTNVDDGINIADKEEYCELRTQYYVWKNYIHEYVGFFQFRRYLDISREVCDVNANKKSRPYIIKKSPNVKGMSLDIILNLKEKYDVIAPIPEYIGISVYERYSFSNGHRIEDLDRVVDILLSKYPYFRKAVEIYLSGSNEYYGNMFFMKKDIYEDYCSWLFYILFTFDEQSVDVLPKTNGYLGERLFGIYFTYLKLQNELSLGELPRVHFYCYDDTNHNLRGKKIINSLLPPGSKSKTMLRKVLYLWKRKCKKKIIKKN
ncbi:DUF4422 domain-containing protein [Clostridium diolis]|uniref:DUF4422 domain-containing protein n=1 Tax=Clostridium diolis TaxID=223919 RepID=UPI0015C5BD16|nr:DUF4422 domain-containing protein [Clostridium diolis]